MSDLTSDLIKPISESGQVSVTYKNFSYMRSDIGSDIRSGIYRGNSIKIDKNCEKWVLWLFWQQKASLKQFWKTENDFMDF